MRAQHRILTRRDNHPGFGERPITAAHVGTTAALATGLAQSFLSPRTRQFDLGIHPNVQFLPACGLLLTVLLSIPCALATDLHATAVND